MNNRLLYPVPKSHDEAAVQYSWGWPDVRMAPTVAVSLSGARCLPCFVLGLSRLAVVIQVVLFLSFQLEEELRKAKAEYEAMNTQLLTELPQFNRLANEVITMAVRAFIAAQRTFVYEFGRCFEQTIGTVSVSVSDGSVLEKFQRKHRQASESVARLCFMGDASSFGGVKSTGGTLVKRQISAGSTVSRASIVHAKQRPTITFPQKVSCFVYGGIVFGLARQRSTVSAANGERSVHFAKPV